MEIPRNLLDSLTREVNALSESAQAQAGAALSRVIAEWDGEDVAALRDATFEVLDMVCGSYCDMCAGRAADFYDSAREAQGVTGTYHAIAGSRRDPEATNGAVRAIVQSVVDSGGDTSRLYNDALSRVDAECRRSANKCVAYNCRRDPKKPKYARVPSGGETCGFCLMLSSFGFHYNTEEAASHAHKGCDCRVVPSFGKASVEGYDPDGMYSRMQECMNDLGGRNGIRADWDAMSDDEREAYISSHGGSESEAFQAYMNKRVSQQIETMNREWFITGDAEAAGRHMYTVPTRKLTSYVLNEASDAGRDKAIAFRSALGFTAEDSDEILRQVYAWVGKYNPTFSKKDRYGERYTTLMTMKGKDGKEANVKAGWIKRPGEGKMQLTSIYVTKKRRR